jgi:hypothetical protein
MDRLGIKQFGKNIYQVWKVLLWVLRFASIIFFGILFFVGLYFKLPWKVLACIAVIPIVGIFVPKKIQPWIWGALTLLIVAVWGWVHLPGYGSTDWRPYEYTDALALIEDDYYPADANNAATIYSSVLDEHGETIFYAPYSDNEEQLSLSGPWDPNTYTFLSYWLSTFDPALDQLIEASRIPECGFDIPYNLASTHPQMRRIYWIKEWVRMLIRSANRDLFVGDQPAALEKLLAALGIAQHLYQQQTLFDQAGAFHIELMAARALERFIIDHCQSPEVMAQIETAFRELDPQWTKNWRAILLREKLLAKNMAALMYQVNASGQTRISHNAMMDLQAGLGFPPRRLFFKQHEMNRLAAIGLWLTLPVSPQRLADIVDDRFDHYSLQVQKGTQLPQYSLKYVWIKGLNVQSVIDWLAMQKVGYFWALDGQFTRHRSIVHQIRIFTALKRYFLQHRRWPQGFEELGLEDDDSILIDPLCGRPFVYQTTTEGFRLYSLGTNGIDDGGVNRTKENKDDILLWPRNQIDIEMDGNTSDEVI